MVNRSSSAVVASAFALAVLVLSGCSSAPADPVVSESSETATPDPQLAAISAFCDVLEANPDPYFFLQAQVFSGVSVQDALVGVPGSVDLLTDALSEYQSAGGDDTVDGIAAVSVVTYGESYGDETDIRGAAREANDFVVAECDGMSEGGSTLVFNEESAASAQAVGTMSITDSQGYTFNFVYGPADITAITSITNAAPGRTDVQVTLSADSSLQNTTPGRALPAMAVTPNYALAFPGSAPICAQADLVAGTELGSPNVFTPVAVGGSCVIGMGTPATVVGSMPGPDASVPLNLPSLSFEASEAATAGIMSSMDQAQLVVFAFIQQASGRGTVDTVACTTEMPGANQRTSAAQVGLTGGSAVCG